MNRVRKALDVILRSFTLCCYSKKAMNDFIHESNMVRYLFQKEYTA